MSEFGDPRLPERFWSKVQPEPMSGCWLWVAAEQGAGYGQVAWKGHRSYLTHRLAYETLRGPIPPGLHIDHLCRVRCCCNPWHMEPVTRGENVRRGIAGATAGARSRAKTHCPAGHEYAGENLLVFKGRRLCLTCKRARNRAHYRRANP